RLNEVSFNAVLLKELRMIALLRQVAQPDTSESAKWADMRTLGVPPGKRSLGVQRRGRLQSCVRPVDAVRPPHRQRRNGRPRLFLEAERGMGVSVHVARRGSP